jgi:hypothetical protein
MNSSIKPSSTPPIKHTICLRPHHLLCLQTFVGHGYSPEFTAHMTIIKKQLTTDPLTPIALINGPDDPCGHCPNCVDGSCTSPKPAVFDHLVGQKLNTTEDTENAAPKHTDASDSPLTLHGIPSILHMSEQLLAECCPDCEWKELCVEVCRTTINYKKNPDAPD